MSGELLTAAQVARKLGVSPSYVRRLARRGLLPAVTLGPRVTRFEESAVAALVASCRTPDRTRRRKPSTPTTYDPVFAGPVPWR